VSARRAGLLLALLCALGASESRAERELRELFPLAVGHRWTYRLHRDQLVDPDDKAAQRALAQGKARTTVVSPGVQPPEGARRFGLREATIERDQRSGRSSSDETLQIVSLSDAGLWLHETSSVGAPEGDAGRVAYDPPRRLLPALLPDGARWQVGSLRIADLELDLSGEVVGSEDLTIGFSDYPGCLKVRIQGPVRGRLFSDDGPVPVGEGRYEREIWLTRGLGIVQEEVRIDLTLDPPGGKPTRYSSVIRRRIESYSLDEE
jgi:hypothetical protein